MARDPSPEERAALDGLATDFTTDYRLRRLVKAIVTRPEYQEGGRYGEEN